MESNLEIGHKVEWTVGKFLCEGIFIEEVDLEFSLVQCLTKNERRQLCQVKVVSSLLHKI